MHHFGVYVDILGHSVKSHSTATSKGWLSMHRYHDIQQCNICNMHSMSIQSKAMTSNNQIVSFIRRKADLTAHCIDFMHAITVFKGQWSSKTHLYTSVYGSKYFLMWFPGPLVKEVTEEMVGPWKDSPALTISWIRRCIHVFIFHASLLSNIILVSISTFYCRDASLTVYRNIWNFYWYVEKHNKWRDHKVSVSNASYSVKFPVY